MTNKRSLPALFLITGLCAVAQNKAEVWTFDNLKKIGGAPVTVLGSPKIIKTPLGKAIQFNGVDDGIFIGKHPLAGAQIFTFEAIFRPESGGAPEQRWFHLAEQDSKTGMDTDSRFLFETRTIGNQWCLDAFVHTPTADKAILLRDHLHSLDAWHHVAMIYDGSEFRSYVDGVLQGKADVKFGPQGPGHTAVGMRANKVFFFKGAVRQAKFTRRALAPEEFMKVPTNAAR